MPVQTKDQFVKQLQKSEIAPNEVIALWLQGLDATDAKKAAEHLVENEHLTPWQAKYLMSGKTKLKFANYVLLELLQKNELGTQFKAKQLMLDRWVKIAFLSKPLSSKLDDLPELVQRIAAASDFDHPNFEHLHVIERASNRYMIVTDYTDSLPLDAPSVLQELKEADVPVILCQAIQAIDFSHHQGISHGSLSEKDILWSGQGPLVVQNILLSHLVLSLSENNPAQLTQFDDDIASLARITKRLVKRLVRDERLASHIKDVVNSMESGDVSLAEAARLIGQPPLKAHDEHTKPTPLEDESIGPIDESRKPAPTKLADGHPDDDRYPMELEAKEKRQRTIRLISQVTTVGLIIAVIYVASASGWLGGKTTNTEVVADDDAVNEELPKLLPNMESRKESPDQQAVENDRSEKANPQTEKLPSHTDDGNQALLDIENDAENSVDELESLNSDEATLDSSASELAESIERTDNDFAVNENQVDTVAVKDDSQSLLQAFDDFTENDTPVSTGTPQANTEPENADEPPIKPTAVAADSSEDETEFQIPSSVALPDVSDTRAIQLINIDRSTDMKLELVSDPKIAPNKVDFKLSNEGSRWTIQQSNTDSSQEIGHIDWEDNSLQFQWTEAAATAKEAGYLSNCQLKIRVDGQSYYVTLRNVAKIDGCVFDRDKPHLKINLRDLKFIPANAYAQLHELDEEHFGQVSFKGDEANRRFSRKKLLEVHFSDLAEYRMMYLLLSSDLKKKAKIELALRLQLSPQERSRTATSKTVETAKQILENAVRDVKQKHDYLKDTGIDEIRKRFNLSKDVYKDSNRDAQVKDLAKLLELNENRFKTFREIQTKIDKWFSNAVPISICYELQGQRIVIATSVTE